MTRHRIIAIAGAALVLTSVGVPALQAQEGRFPLAPPRPAGDIVAPFFDGWYPNEDGTYTLSFGFMNRNTEQTVDIPLGPDNYIEPAEYDGGQPTHFPAVFRGGFNGRRERGAFAITIPPEMAGNDVVWTLTHAGRTWSVPGRVTSPAYELGHIPASAGSLPPAVRFAQDGEESTGREGIRLERQTVAVGEPLQLSVLVRDRGEREPTPVNATWQKHQGIGSVSFEPTTQRIDAGGEWGEAVAAATFTEAGDYVVRVRVDNFTFSDSRFDNQCCWSNAFVPVTVAP